MRPETVGCVADVPFRVCSLGGMCGAIVTSPFDVVKTRLQSDMFKHAAVVASDGTTVVVRRNLLWHFVETGHILRWVLLLYSAAS